MDIEDFSFFLQRKEKFRNNFHFMNFVKSSRFSFSNEKRRDFNGISYEII